MINLSRSWLFRFTRRRWRSTFFPPLTLLPWQGMGTVCPGGRGPTGLLIQHVFICLLVCFLWMAWGFVLINFFSKPSKCDSSGRAQYTFICYCWLRPTEERGKEAYLFGLWIKKKYWYLSSLLTHTRHHANGFCILYSFNPYNNLDLTYLRWVVMLDPFYRCGCGGMKKSSTLKPHT